MSSISAAACAGNGGGQCGDSRKRKVQEKVFDVVKETLTCLVCMELLVSNIYTCPEGHPICSDCKAQLPEPKKCPTCGSFQLDIRNRMCEKIAEKLEVECPHDGCGAMVRAPLLKAHKRHCAHRPIKCSSLHPTCTFAGSVEQLIKHLHEQHSFSVGRDGSGFDTERCLHVSDNQSKCLDFFAQGLHWKSVLQKGDAKFICRAMRKPAPSGKGTFHVALLSLPTPTTANAASADQKVTIKFCPKAGVDAPTVSFAGVRVMSLRNCAALPQGGISAYEDLPPLCEAVLPDKQAFAMCGGVYGGGNDIPMPPAVCQVNFQISI
eukprot:GDKI01032690.1.p1 GENE.GDKI01032690.1~~GDKI01032690.1.p1  ORF type:complete len:321 (-),score=71.75 GDKI01032690.1:147-1109(-)